MLSREDIKNELIEVLLDKFEMYSFKIEDIDMDQSIFNLGLDSVDIMVLMTVLEEKYKIRVSSDKFESFSTINIIVDLIYNLVKEK